jgi:hypothetical protein
MPDLQSFNSTFLYRPRSHYFRVLSLLAGRLIAERIRTSTIEKRIVSTLAIPEGKKNSRSIVSNELVLSVGLHQGMAARPKRGNCFFLVPRWKTNQLLLAEDVHVETKRSKEGKKKPESGLASAAFYSLQQRKKKKCKSFPPERVDFFFQK